MADRQIADHQLTRQRETIARQPNEQHGINNISSYDTLTLWIGFLGFIFLILLLKKVRGSVCLIRRQPDTNVLLFISMIFIIFNTIFCSFCVDGMSM
jgi:hypothetical protein